MGSFQDFLTNIVGQAGQSRRTGRNLQYRQQMAAGLAPLFYQMQEGDRDRRSEEQRYREQMGLMRSQAAHGGGGGQSGGFSIVNPGALASGGGFLGAANKDYELENPRGEDRYEGYGGRTAEGGGRNTDIGNPAINLVRQTDDTNRFLASRDAQLRKDYDRWKVQDPTGYQQKMNAWQTMKKRHSPWDWQSNANNPNTPLARNRKRMFGGFADMVR